MFLTSGLGWCNIGYNCDQINNFTIDLLPTLVWSISLKITLFTAILGMLYTYQIQFEGILDNKCNAEVCLLKFGSIIKVSVRVWPEEASSYFCVFYVSFLLLSISFITWRRPFKLYDDLFRKMRRKLEIAGNKIMVRLWPHFI